MADWSYLRIKLPKITETTTWTVDSIYEIFSEMDYDFPKNSLNGESAYRSPQFSSNDIVQILFDKFGIDDAIVNLSSEDDSFDEKNNVTYKSVYAFKIQESKFKNNIDKLLEKYELTNYKPYVTYSEKTNYRGPRFYVALTIKLLSLEFNTSFECLNEYSEEFFDLKFAEIAKIIEVTKL